MKYINYTMKVRPKSNLRQLRLLHQKWMAMSRFSNEEDNIILNWVELVGPGNWKSCALLLHHKN